jgi:hypothetical protein
MIGEDLYRYHSRIGQPSPAPANRGACDRNYCSDAP